jgi:hypothetical protein
MGLFDSVRDLFVMPVIDPEPVPALDEVDEEELREFYPEVGLSLYPIRPGTKRPEMWMASACLHACGYDVGEQGGADRVFVEALKKFQADFGLKPDGWIGTKSWPVVVAEGAEAGYVPPLWRRCQAMSCHFENGSVDAYGMAQNDIGDKAGANYGIVQHNARGSMKTLLKFIAGRKDLWGVYNHSNTSKVNRKIKKWMGSPEGIAAQDTYFQKKIWEWALRRDKDLEEAFANSNNSIAYQRLLAFLVDTRIQNGSLFSRGRKPFWRSYLDTDPRGFRYRELYQGKLWDKRFEAHGIPYSRLQEEWWKAYQARPKQNADARGHVNKELQLQYLKELDDAQLKLMMLAQWRSRCSSPRWWYDVCRRRMTVVTGTGKVHGDNIDTAKNFGIGTHYWVASGAQSAAKEGKADSAAA